MVDPPVAVAPGGKHVSVFTDRGRLIVMRARSAVQVANIYGFDNNELSQPRHCWHPAGDYIFATSSERLVVVVSLAAQSIVQSVRVHGALLRDLTFSAETDRLYTVGYDQKLVTLRPSRNEEAVDAVVL